MAPTRRLAVLLIVVTTTGLAACSVPRPRTAPERWPQAPGRLGGLGPERGGPRPEVLALALRAFECGRAAGHFRDGTLTVIDYSLPSTERRLWVLDVDRRRVLFRELVAHGEGSGDLHAVAFSNVPGSRQSSLGLFRTGETYWGRHGRSLRLTGLEPGVNDRAEERAIVIHGAPYVSEAFIAEHGRLGRSWGCPALPLGVHDAVIDRIRGGTAVFVYYPERQWLAASDFLQCDTRLVRRWR